MFPKTQRQESPHLRRMARNYGCQLRCAAGCRGEDTSTTVMAHSNWSDLGGKGGARKADDSAGVYGCVACHQWLDTGPARAQEKRALRISMWIPSLPCIV